MSETDTPPYDAFLLLSFGGPEGPEDVVPFLRNVTRGRGIPDERLAVVGQHYAHFDGISPINAQCRALLTAIGERFEERGVNLPLYWGNRNWYPFLSETVATMTADGVRRALVLATSATSSYSACRQYRENLQEAIVVTGEGAPELVKLRHYFDHPGFIAANVAGLREALTRLPQELRDEARLIFTAHSIPVSMNDSSGPEGNLYVRQQRESARLVAEAVRGPGAQFDMVWQSRSGPPQVPWLEPDINDHLTALAAQGVRAVAIAATGFVSDHIEVAWDLDTEARATAQRLGIAFTRGACAGTHPAFVDGIVDLVLEQLAPGDAPAHLGELGICGWQCPDGCCQPPRRPAHPAGRPTAVSA